MENHICPIPFYTVLLICDVLFSSSQLGIWYECMIWTPGPPWDEHHISYYKKTYIPCLLLISLSLLKQVFSDGLHGAASMQCCSRLASGDLMQTIAGSPRERGHGDDQLQILRLSVNYWHDFYFPSCIHSFIHRAESIDFLTCNMMALKIHLCSGLYGSWTCTLCGCW